MSKDVAKAQPYPRQIKTLDDVKADMSELYEEVRAGRIDMKVSAELSNITGKFLKAVSLEQSREQFLANQSRARVSHEPS